MPESSPDKPGSALQGPLPPQADLLGLILGAPAVAALCEALVSRARCVATGAVGSLSTLVAGAIARRAARPVMLIVAHADEADEALAELRAQGLGTIHLPALEVLPGETGVSTDLLAARIAAVRAVVKLPPSAGTVIIAPIPALMQAVPRPESLPSLCLTVTRGMRLDPATLVRWLEAAGFARADAIEEPGDYAVRGGIVDIFPPFTSAPASDSGPAAPIRLDFFGDELDRLTEIDLDTMGSDRAIDTLEILAAGGDALRHIGDQGVNFLHLLPRSAIAVLAETLEIVEQARGYYERVTDSAGIDPPPRVLALAEQLHAVCEVNQFSAGSGGQRFHLPAATLPEFPREVAESLKELAALVRPAGDAAPRAVWVCTDNPGEQARLRELVSQHIPDHSADIQTRPCYLHRGFIWGADSVPPLPITAPRDGQRMAVRGEGGDAARAPARAPEPPLTPSRPASPARGREPSEEGTNEARGHGGVREGHPTLLIPYNELLHRFHARRPAGGIKSTRAMDTFLDFKVGDYVVHADHGIALFTGLALMPPRSLPGHGKSAADILAEAARKAGKPKPIHLSTKKPSRRASNRPGEHDAHASATNRSSPPDSGPHDNDDESPHDHLEEYLTLEFAAKSRLHVPATQIDRVQKYIGGFAGKPPLSTLGGTRWQAQKDRVSESVRDLAAELLRVRAARESIPGIRYPADTVWQGEFEDEFPYEETPDQVVALESIKKDMSSQRPMDRLVCGDVGFGKTELAIRAAFKACEFGKQVAVLVPTTVLAEQHERTFRSRFADYPFRVESLSRFKSTKEVNDTLAALRKGQVDVVIGTHRLLSRDVRFADLGLVVIDEEQRFGVEHKERLLQLRMTVDVLTLSATPIPRTLHMALLGIRDISSLTTPPADRRAIVTEVIPYNPRRVAQAIRRELAREGQVFFVHNRVHNIERIADEVRAMAPGATVVIGHGQMPDGALEDVMLRFMRREADILVSTTIIESGIDIPTANTMIINDADRFGLAELHQLRGRVGRSKHRAYCYLLLPEDRTINEVAQKRLKAIEQYAMLGAGFKIAMRDLEIRGAGNLLGPEQSGHIAAVGYEMYCHLLEDTVLELKNEKPPPPPSATTVEIGVAGLIPRAYIPSDQRRLEAYRRLAVAPTLDDLTRVHADLTAAYGTPPRAVERLFDLARIRILAAGLGARAVTIRDNDLVFRAADPAPLADRLRDAPASSPGTVRVLAPKSSDTLAEVYLRLPPAYFEASTLVRVLALRLTGGAAGGQSRPEAGAGVSAPGGAGRAARAKGR